MILLTNKNQCPGCGKINTLRWDSHVCVSCNTRVFSPESSFNRMKDDFLLSFWVFFRPRAGGMFQGWVHSSHLEEPKPYVEQPNLEKPDSDYGKRDVSKLSAGHTPEALGMEQYKTSPN